jgi:hypothetical protein
MPKLHIALLFHFVQTLSKLSSGYRKQVPEWVTGAGVKPLIDQDVVRWCSIVPGWGSDLISWASQEGCCSDRVQTSEWEQKTRRSCISGLEPQFCMPPPPRVALHHPSDSIQLQVVTQSSRWTSAWGLLDFRPLPCR